jgi:predicted nucleotidyltransferase
VLGWLLSHPGERYFVRQLAGILAEDPTNLSRELARLASLGILAAATEGQQKYYRANPSSPIYPELRSLIAKTAGIGAILRGALEPLSNGIQSAFIFGSVAAGREAQASDVDVMVIGGVTLEELIDVLSPLQNQLGREVNPSVYTAAEVRQRLARGNHFLSSVLNGPKLFLIGSANELERLAEVRLAD